MNLVEELKENGVDLIKKRPVVKCEVFEDNVGAMELAKFYSEPTKVKWVSLPPDWLTERN